MALKTVYEAKDFRQSYFLIFRKQIIFLSALFFLLLLSSILLRIFSQNPEHSAIFIVALITACIIILLFLLPFLLGQAKASRTGKVIIGLEAGEDRLLYTEQQDGVQRAKHRMQYRDLKRFLVSRKHILLFHRSGACFVLRRADIGPEQTNALTECLRSHGIRGKMPAAGIGAVPR